MPMGARDEPFAAFVSAYRSRLLGTASLIHADPEQAEGLVDAVLAQVYASWPRLDDPYTYALRAVVSPASVGVRLSEEAVHRFELVDVEGGRAVAGEDIRSELAALTSDERRVLVLASFTRLPLPQIAAVLDRDVSDVVAQLRAATDRLQDMPRRQRRRRLTVELAAAAADVPVGAPAVDRPKAGRSLLRQRRLRVVAVAAAVVLVAGLGIRSALPLVAPPVDNGPQVAATTPSPAPPCDVSEAKCRSQIVMDWRTEMAGVISSYLDPTGTYFTGSSYSYVVDGMGSDLWTGGDGALELRMSRISDGATEVFLQIASSRRSATPCGQTTKQECRTLRFMDGNNFTMTDPSTVAQGLEVRHRPDDTDVILIVARNTSRFGRELPVTRADLVTLIADKRLRLPPR